MSEKSCRLCLGDQKLINMFDKRLVNSKSLRKCILLATGVKICQADKISKYVCKNCSDITIFSYKFRHNALANDKALKECTGQRFITPPLYKTEITKIKNNFLKLLKAKSKEQKVTKELEIHPGIIQLTKILPDINTPETPGDVAACKETEQETFNKVDEVLLRPGSSGELDNAKYELPKITESPVNGDELSCSYGTAENIISDESDFEDVSRDSLLFISDAYDSEVSLQNISEASTNLSNKRKLPKLDYEDTEQGNMKSHNLNRTSSFSNSTRESEENDTSSLELLSTLDSTTKVEDGKAKRLQLCKARDSSEDEPKEISNSITPISNDRWRTTSPKHSEKKLVFSCTNCNKKFRNMRQLNCHKRTDKQRLTCDYLFYSNRNSKCSKGPELSVSETFPEQNFVESETANYLGDAHSFESAFNGPGTSRSLERDMSHWELDKTDQVEFPKISLEEISNKFKRFPLGNEPEFLIPNTNLRQADEAKVQEMRKQKGNDFGKNGLYKNLSAVIPQVTNADLAESIFSSTNTIGGYSLLKTGDVEPVFDCQYCPKFFDSAWKLKCHQRYHRPCTVCGTVFGSHKSLKQHQKEICFKNIIANPPFLRLTRIDEDVEIKREFPQIFASA